MNRRAEFTRPPAAPRALTRRRACAWPGSPAPAPWPLPAVSPTSPRSAPRSSSTQRTQAAPQATESAATPPHRRGHRRRPRPQPRRRPPQAGADRPYQSPFPPSPAATGTSNPSSSPPRWPPPGHRAALQVQPHPAPFQLWLPLGLCRNRGRRLRQHPHRPRHARAVGPCQPRRRQQAPALDEHLASDSTFNPGAYWPGILETGKVEGVNTPCPSPPPPGSPSSTATARLGRLPDPASQRLGRPGLRGSRPRHARRPESPGGSDALGLLLNVEPMWGAPTSSGAGRPASSSSSPPSALARPGHLRPPALRPGQGHRRDLLRPRHHLRPADSADSNRRPSGSATPRVKLPCSSCPSAASASAG